MVWLMISAQSVPFRLDASCCPFPSAQRMESLFGEVFWGFISSPCILISYLLTEIVSSSRNQFSHMRLPLFCRLVRGLPSPPSPSLSPVIFVSRRWRRVRRGSPSSRGPRPLETFAHGPVSSGPMGAASSSSLKIEPRKFNGIKYLPFSRIHVQILC